MTMTALLLLRQKWHCCSWTGQVLLQVLLIIIIFRVDASYVSYETARGYREGHDSLQLVVNKVYSPSTLSSVDYKFFPVCHQNENDNNNVNNNNAAVGESTSQWHQTASAWYGDAFRILSSIPPLPILQDVYCAPMECGSIASNANTNNNPIVFDDSAWIMEWEMAIARDYAYHAQLDDLPVECRLQDDSMLMSSYWSGISVGRKAHDFTNDGRWNVTPEAATNGFFLHNHWNIEIHYKQIKDEYFILKTTIEPFSIEQFNSSTGSANLASCRRDLNETEQQQHTRFEKLTTVPLQPLSFGSIVHFTYDVTWIRDDTTRHSKRWDPVLSSGQTYGVRSVEFGGVVLGAFILASLVGALTTWILRDFSYKPIAVNSEIVEGDFTDEEATELNMWPLSKWIFFPPRHAPILFCILCGTGAHLLLASLCFLVLFRLGIISQSQGANLLTPATITYTMSAIVGGYVTARLYAIFHGTRNVALASSLITAIAYPLLGLLVSFLVYDVLPGAQSPLYNLTSNSTPLILIWLFWMWPWTVLGGLFGHRAGPITDFPVSAGSSGYQDLDLPDDKETITGPDVVRPRSILARYTRKCRIAILLATGGLLPVLSCFISFSYGIAGPILRGFYVSTSFGIISYTIFVSISASLAVLLYYRQIRTNRYEWWWAAFATAGSAGIYIFLLSMSYILVHLSSSIGSNVSGASVAIYILWFGYLALGVLLINGFAGVLTCVMFNKVMYKYIMSRQ